MKITKEEFDKLYTDDITKKEFDRIIRKIDDRFGEIYLTLNPDIKKRGWFDYENCNYESEVSGGYFDHIEYKEYIGIGGEYSELPMPYEYEIPTRWLWEENFGVEFKKEVSEYEKTIELKKKKVKVAEDKRKLKKEKLQKSIAQKLTKEELKIINFK